MTEEPATTKKPTTTEEPTTTKRPTTTKQPTTTEEPTTTKPTTLPPTPCAVNQTSIRIQTDDCQSTRLVKVASCSGMCPSGSQFHSSAPFYKSDCHCCQPTEFVERYVKMNCLQTGSRVIKISVIKRCECNICENNGEDNGSGGSGGSGGSMSDILLSL